MIRKLAPLAAVAFLFVASAPAARACDDNSDTVVAKLQKLDLTTEQLNQIFAYRKEHKDLIVKSHRDGSGCLVHERNGVVFEKQAVGILNDAQFKKYAGRERNETESLRYQNYLLKAEIEKLKKELELLKTQTEAKKTEAKSTEAPAKKEECCEEKKKSV